MIQQGNPARNIIFSYGMNNSEVRVPFERKAQVTSTNKKPHELPFDVKIELRAP